jgi:hypothetical protein
MKITVFNLWRKRKCYHEAVAINLIRPESGEDMAKMSAAAAAYREAMA